MLEEQRDDLHQPGDGHHQDAGDDHQADVLLQRLVGEKAMLFLCHEMLLRLPGRPPARPRAPSRGYRFPAESPG
ncbi:Uncharacterised protein [Bordetella pertussis]|nr:Uncharacterised protein [Bordetella pertussis]